MPPILTYLPGAKHTYLSDVNRTRLPNSVTGYLKSGAGFAPVDIAIKDGDGRLLETAIPKVNILKEGNYTPESVDAGPDREVDILALMNDNFTYAPLAGFVIEGQAPYGTMTNSVRNALTVKASYCGMPVVRVGRGNNEGFAAQAGVHIGGGNLTSTKARLLLLALPHEIRRPSARGRSRQPDSGLRRRQSWTRSTSIRRYSTRTSTTRSIRGRFRQLKCQKDLTHRIDRHPHRNTAPQ